MSNIIPVGNECCNLLKKKCRYAWEKVFLKCVINVLWIRMTLLKIVNFLSEESEFILIYPLKLLSDFKCNKNKRGFFKRRLCELSFGRLSKFEYFVYQLHLYFGPSVSVMLTVISVAVYIYVDVDLKTLGTLISWTETSVESGHSLR